MALCRAYGSTNAVYLGIRYQENKNQQVQELRVELEENSSYI